MKRIWCGFIYWLLTTSFLAASELTLDWEDRLLDDPQSFLLELEQELEQIDTAKDYRLWLQSYWQWQRATQETNALLDRDGLDKFAKAAAEQGLELIALDLERLYLDSLASGQKQQQELKTRQILDFVQRVESRTVPHIRPLAWLSLGLHYDAIGQAPLAIEAYQKSLNLLDQDKVQSRLTRMNLMSSISVIFYNDGKLDQALNLKRQILESCRKHQWRSFCADAFYNLGSMLTEQGDPLLLNEADSAFSEAERLAKSIQSASFLARVDYGRLKYYTKIEDLPKALYHGKKALLSFRQLNDTQFMTATLERLARVEQRSGNLEAALTYSKEALRTLEDKDYGRRKELYYLIYSLEKQRAQTAAALTALETFTAISQNQNNLKDDADFNKLAADLGLKFEAERSKALRAELELEATKRRSVLSLLLLSLLALAILFGYFRQVRQTQQLRYREKVALERETNEKILHLESELRFNLASAVAHRINNPLNQISLNLESQKLQQKNIQESLEALLGSDPQADPEVIQVRQEFGDMFRIETELSLQMQTALQKTSSAVAELRALSGIDGYSCEPYTLAELCSITDHRLKELLTAEDYERLSFELPSDADNFTMIGNIFLTKNALELLVLSFLKSDTKPLLIRFTLVDRNHLLVSTPQLNQENKALLAALELSMSNMLRPAGGVATHSPAQSGFLIQSLAEVTRS